MNELQLHTSTWTNLTMFEWMKAGTKWKETLTISIVWIEKPDKSKWQHDTHINVATLLIPEIKGRQMRTQGAISFLFQWICWLQGCCSLYNCPINCLEIFMYFSICMSYRKNTFKLIRIFGGKKDYFKIMLRGFYNVLFWK